MVRPPTAEPASAATFDRLANPWACLKSFSANSILDISKNFSALQYKANGLDVSAEITKVSLTVGIG